MSCRIRMCLESDKNSIIGESKNVNENMKKIQVKNVKNYEKM